MSFRYSADLRRSRLACYNHTPFLEEFVLQTTSILETTQHQETKNGNSDQILTSLTEIGSRIRTNSSTGN